MPGCATTRSSRRWGSREPSDEPGPVPRVLRDERGAVPAAADPGRTFPALSYDSARAALVEGITERRGLLCLVGEAGTGKTLLLRTLLEAPPPGVRPVMLLQPGIEFEALVEFLALQLGRPAESAASGGLDGLRAALAAEAEAGRNVVLLVEEAQALPSSTLAALPELILPLTGSGRSALQVLLAGPPPPPAPA